MCALKRPFTYDDLLQMPDDGLRREVIGGELFVNPAPRREHQTVSSNFDWILQRFLRSTGAGRAYAHPVDVCLSRTDVVQPDLVAIRQDRLHIYRPEGVVVEPPDLVVEIISPSSKVVDRVRKLALYSRSGVPEYWIADPERRLLAAYRLENEDYVQIDPDPDGAIPSHAFPGLRIHPDEVFAGLDEIVWRPGELIVNATPTADHQRVVGNLYVVLRDYSRATGSGEVFMAPFDVLLGRHDVVQPDLVFQAADRPRVAGDCQATDGPPDLVVEVVSPGTGFYDRVRKMALYARSGVPEYWIADAVGRTFVANVLKGEEYVPLEPESDGTIASRQLPGLRVDPEEVFAGLE